MWGIKDTHGEYVHRSSYFWGKNYIIYTSDIDFAYTFLKKVDAVKALVRCNNVFKKQEQEVVKNGTPSEITTSYRSDTNVWVDREYAQMDLVKLGLVERP